VMVCERWREALRRRSAGTGAKPPGAALAEDRRGERPGKKRTRASGGVQEDVPETVGREARPSRTVEIG